MGPVVFVIQGAISKEWKGAVIFAISVAVGITPEMLPMIVVRLSLRPSHTELAKKKTKRLGYAWAGI